MSAGRILKKCEMNIKKFKKSVDKKIKLWYNTEVNKAERPRSHRTIGIDTVE